MVQMPRVCNEVFPDDDPKRGGPGLISPCILLVDHDGDHCSEVVLNSTIRAYQLAYKTEVIPTVVWPRRPKDL